MLTRHGFKKKLYIDHLEELEKHARELWGADIDLTDSSPLGRWIRLVAKKSADISELAEKTYNYGHIDDAEGVSLDYEAKKIGLSRIQAAKSIGRATFSVSDISDIAPGIIISTQDGIEFVTTEPITDDDETGSVTVEIEALQAGFQGDVPANTIVEINTPLPGLDGVNNSNATDHGQDVETDTEFRERYYRSLSNAGGASIPSVEAAILAVSGVIDATVDENDTENYIDDLPPHCIAPFVHGGTDSSVAQVIFQRKAGGIRSYGTTVVDITDSKGRVHKIGFSRPVTVDIWANITITKSPDSDEYPENGDELIVSKIVEHIGGTDADGTKYSGQGSGADVVQYKLLGAISDIPGIDDVAIELSTDGENYSNTKIVIDKRSIAQTQYDKVVIQ